MKKQITLQQLQALGACDDALETFEAVFGEAVVPTLKLAETHADDFDWDWAAPTLLGAAALAKYRRVRAAALAEYRREADIAENTRARAAAFMQAWIGDQNA